MLTKNTVLILGAGASRPFGYPMGKELKKKILNKVDKNEYHLTRLRDQLAVDFESAQLTDSWQFESQFLMKKCGFSPHEIVQFYTHFSSSHKSSIDSFLENRDKRTLWLGKALIAMSIFECESYNELFSDNDENWYKYLMRTLDHDSFEKILENNLSIITYNYDRSLEYFLVNALALTHNRNSRDCREKLQQFPFIHVHGSIASLPFDGKAYDKAYTAKNVDDSIRNLNLISEEEQVKSAYSEVHQILSKAANIFILGFGFDSRNLQRLELLKHAKNAQIFATRTGMSDLEVRTINKGLDNKIIFSSNENHDIINFFRREVNLHGDISRDTIQYYVQMCGSQ